MSMLHSLWQGGILILLYGIAEISLLRRFSPLEKRNLLYLLIATQLGLFILSFCIYYFLPGETSSVVLLSSIADAVVETDLTHRLTPWIFSAYISFMVFKLAKAVYTWHIFKKQYRQGLQRPAIDLKLFTELKSHHFGIKRKVQLWCSNNIHTPVTFGFLRPVILLPVALVNQISMKQAESLILHELTHIRANDYLLNWFLVIAENIFFFNPFVTRMARMIRMEREKFCDISVIRFAYSPAVYAEALLQAEKIRRTVPVYQLAAVSRKFQLLHRISYFSNENNSAVKNSRGLMAPLAGGLLMLLIAFALLLRPGTKAPAGAALLSAEASPGYVSDHLVEKNSSPAMFASLTDAALKTSTEALKTIDLEKLANEIDQQRPLIEKEIKNIQPMLQYIQDHPEEYMPTKEEMKAIPIADVENDYSKQILVEEESSETRSASAKLYQMVFKNGQWVVEPEFMAAIQDLKTALLNKQLDSLNRKVDSAMRKVRLLRQQ